MLRVNREEFLQRLESVQPGLSTREIVEQSSCFVFQDGMVMTYNDEVSCTQKLDIELSGAVQATKLLELLRKMTETEIEIEQKDAELLVYGKGHRRRAGIPREKDVLLPVAKVERPKGWNKLNRDFADAIDIVHTCAGSDETLTTTCVHMTKKFVEACDNYQMSRYRLKTGFEKSMLVRKDSIKHIISLGMTHFAETPSWIHFKNPSGLVLSCRREIQDYRNLTPYLQVTGEPMALPKAIGDATDKAQIFAAETSDEVQVEVQLRPGKIIVRGQGGAGWFEEERKLSYKGPKLHFSIAPKLLSEITSRHNECQISEKCLRVDGGKFVYVASLEAIRKKEPEADEQKKHKKKKHAKGDRVRK